MSENFSAIIHRLRAGRVRDLRSGMVNIIAALVAEGESEIEGIEEIDIFELVDPASKPEEVIGGGREEIDRRLVMPEEFVDI